MNMNEAQFFDSVSATGASNPAGSPHPGGGGMQAIIYLVLGGLAWLFVSYWSVKMVAYGIETAGLFPPTVTPTEILLFAVCLQVMTSLFGLITGFFFRSVITSVLWAVACVVVVLTIAFEGYHGVLGQNKASVGPALLAQERAELDTLSRRITTASDQLASTYQAKTKAYETLAQNAAQGKDKTGIASCDAICKANWDKFGIATARFSHLALAAAPPALQLAPDADARALLTDVQARSAKLDAASADLSAFYRTLDNSTPPAVLSQEIAAIRSLVNTKTEQYKDLHSLSAYTLALDQTNKAFAAIWDGKLPPPEARLPLVYGLLPALTILVLGLYIKVCLNVLGPHYYGVGHVAMNLASESLAARMLKRLERLRKENYVSSLRSKYMNWRSNGP
jgi:hypothetical protein